MKLPVNGIIRRTYLRSVPYPNQTLKRDFSKTLRYKLKVNITTIKIGWCDIFSNFQLKLIVTFEIFIYHKLSILSVN